MRSEGSWTKLINPDTDEICDVRLVGTKIIINHTRPAFGGAVDIEKAFSNIRSARRYCKRKGFTDPAEPEYLDIARRLI